MSVCGVKMVVGLGNPGAEYEGTRHNAGFMVIDSLASALGIKVRKKKFGGVLGEGEYLDKKLILLKPCQYMNRSGQVVATAVGFYKLCLSEMFVVSDDIALEPGRIRIRARGSAGGQKGLTDILEKLGTDEVNRLRVGIGQSGVQASEDYVLTTPSAEEKPLLEAAIDKARDAVLCWIEFGIDEAMNRFNFYGEDLPDADERA
ncbi:MAG: aminoacyl-tRNA hydrolase [Planctomycetota bacterium]|jgi:PTH1 family peptidyl-tRNA hydrolase